jgi:hypothetical protein
MALKIQPPIFKEFTLEKSDTANGNTESPTKIRIRQATRGEHEARNHLFAESKREFVGGRAYETVDLSRDDLRRKEVFLTLAYANIENADGEPLFKFKNDRLVDEFQFIIAWNQLDYIVAEEIIECVHDLNIQWDDLGNE